MHYRTSTGLVTCGSKLPQWITVCRRRRFGPSFSAKSPYRQKRVRTDTGRHQRLTFLFTRSIFQPDLISAVLMPFLAPFADGPEPRYPTLAR